MRILPVKVPEGDGRGIDDRLAQRIAYLFGVDVPSSPGGCTWVMDYDALTLAEIARGGPLPSREPVPTPGCAEGDRIGYSSVLPEGWWIVDRALIRGEASPGEPWAGALHVTSPIQEIAASSLNRGRPDRKAAAVLRAANVLFAEPTRTIKLILDLLGPEVDVGSRLMLWAALLLEAYRSQPALFAAAIQARSIQRAFASLWGPRIGTQEGLARAELGSKYLTKEISGPDAAVLEILDRTVPDLAADAFAENTWSGLLSTHIADLMADQLVYRASRGYVWLTESGGRRAANVAFATQPQLVGLVSSVMGLQHQDQNSLREYFPATRALPAVPSPGAVDGWNQQSLEALVTVLWSLVRGRGELNGSSNGFGKQREHFLAELEQFSSNLLGPIHPVTVEVGITLRSKRYLTMKPGDEVADAVLEEARGLLAHVVTYLDLYQRAQVTPGAFVTLVTATLPNLRKAIGALYAAGMDETAEQYRNELSALWLEIFNTLGLNKQLALQELKAGGPNAEALANLLHNYPPFLAAYGTSDDKLFAVEMAYRIAQLRNSQALLTGIESGFRRSLQVFTGMASQLVRDGTVPEENRALILERVHATAAKIARANFGRMAQEGSLEGTTTARMTLMRLIDAWLLDYEFGVEPARTPDEILRHIERLDPVYGAVIGGGSFQGERVKQWRELQVRFLRLFPDLARERSVEVGEPHRVQKPGSSPTAVELPDEALFQALRGHPRRVAENPIAVQFALKSAGVVRVSLELPFVDDAVEMVTTTLSAGNESVEVPLSWNVVPGRRVEMTGDVSLPKGFDWEQAMLVTRVIRKVSQPE